MRNKVIIFIILVLIAGAGYFYYSDRNVEPAENGAIPQVESLSPQAGLPPLVEAKRQAIYKAAMARDYALLAAEAGEDLSYSFGGPVEGGFAEFLRMSEASEKESAFDIIPALLKMPYAVLGDNLIYAWPSVFSKEPKDWTPEDISMMKTILTDEQIEQYRQFGHYLYYRIGITTEGKWIYYIAGD